MVYMLFLVSVHQGILLDIIFYLIVETLNYKNIMKKPLLIMQILCQGTINYLLFITSEYEKTPK